MTGTPFAKLLDAIPVVPTTAYRNAFYVSPTINTRVHNLATGNIEMWDGSAWQTIFEGVTSGAGRVIFTGATTPNGTQVGSAGDAYVQQVSATVTLLWLKQSGTGTNTGWQALSATGTGSPESVVAAPIGVTYAQTDGATGNVTWTKNSGTGNTGWRPLQTGLGVYNVLDYGAKGDHVTDDTVAIQAAVTAAGIGGHIYFPPGTYLCSGNITGLDFQTWEGSTFTLGAGGTTTSELRWPGISGATIGVTLGTNSTMRNLLLRGPGKTVGTCIGVNDGGSSPRFDHVQFYSWVRGVNLVNAFYTIFESCEWYVNAIGVATTNTYNLSFLTPTFRCYDSTAGTGGTAIFAASGPIRNLKIFGGSIEGYSASGAIKLQSGSQVLCDGVYWESSIAGTNAFGIELNSGTAMSVVLTGNLVYLSEVNRWLNASGAAGTIAGYGNKFICSSGSSTTPIAYALAFTGDISLAGDDWNDVALAGALYTNQVNNYPLANAHILPPTSVASIGANHYIGRPVLGVSTASYTRFLGRGTAHVAGDYVLSARWGTTASISAVSAKDTGGRVTIASAGTGQAANPTVTLTWKDGTWTTAPAVVASRGDLVAPSGPFLNTTPGATTVVFTFNGTPVAGNSYILDFVAMGK